MQRGVVTGDDLTITTELEPQERKPLNDIVQTFDDFWAVFPRKQGKGKAKEAFMKAVKDGAVAAEVLAGAIRYASDPNLPDPQFVPLPATWLNQERWEDGPLPMNRKLTNAEKGALLVEKWRAEEMVGEPKQLDYDWGLRLKGVDDE